MRYLSFIALFAAITFAGCSDSDTESPLISDLVITPQPGVGVVCGEEDANVIRVLTGDSITVSFTATDNEMLSQYKIDLHQNFDCHGHSNKMATTDWEVSEIMDVTGTSSAVSTTFAVPDSATSGSYHFSIQLADHFGNSAITGRYSINVLNLEDTVPPVLTAVEPSSSAFTISLSDTIPNDTVVFIGNVTDNLNLGISGNGKLELRYWATGSPNIFNLYSIQFLELDGESYNFDFTVQIPATLVAGEYVFELRAFDGVNNPSETVNYTVTIE